MTEQPPLPPSGDYPLLPTAGGYQPTPPGAGWPPPGPVDDLPKAAYASWIRRVGAYLIDYLLLLIAGAVAGLIAGLIEMSCTTGSCGGLSVLTRIISAVLSLAPLAFLTWNEGYRQGITGSSLGKSALKFKVVSERTGQPIGFGPSVARYFAHFIDAVIFGIGYLLPLVTAKRQTIADMMMSTVCLPNEPPSARRSRTPWIIAGATAVVIAIVAVLALTFMGHKSSSRQVVLAFSGLKNPAGVAVDNTGAVYVVDTDNNRVLKLPAGATTATTLPFTGLNRPLGVAIDTNGAVYVADSGDNRVLKLPAGATTPTTLPLSGLNEPKAVAVDSAGSVYVTASVKEPGGTRGQVLKLAPGATDPTKLPFTFFVTAFGGPSGVAVDTAGTVYIADGRVLRLAVGATAADTLPLTNPTNGGGAWGVAVDTAGAVYVTDSYNQRVVKLAAGSTAEVVQPFSGLGQPHGVALDSAGNLYVSDSTNRVLKLPPG